MRHRRLIRKLVREETRNVRKFDRLKGSYSFQGHMNNERDIELENLSSFNPDQIHSIINKPKGFWTSTVFKDADSFKTKWKEFGGARFASDFFHAYTVVNNPNILHIGSRNKAIEIFANKNFEGIWENIFNEYDATHVFGSALAHPKFENWDIESTVWFRPKNYLKEQFVWKT